MVKKSFKNYLFCTLAIILSFVISTIDSFAQPSFVTGGQENGVTLAVSPENPKPNQAISFSLSSYSNNLDSATMRWYIDDVIKKEGVGIKSFNTRTGKSGDLINLRVEISTNDGKQFQQTLTVNPAQVDIIVEAGSYVPPLYKGRAYFVSQGVAKIIALPDIVKNGKKLGVRELTFKWKQNITSLANASGLGKNTLIVEGSVPIKDIDIELQVLDSSGKTVATESVIISPHKTQIYFYEDSSLYGVLLNKIVSGDYPIGNKEEIKIVAKPYFFDISDVNSSEIKYKWSVNGKSVVLGGKKNEILLKQGADRASGAAAISLAIENQVRIFQYASNNFNIIFGN